MGHIYPISSPEAARAHESWLVRLRMDRPWDAPGEAGACPGGHHVQGNLREVKMAGTPGGNQRPWWEKEQPASVPAVPRSRGVAYYRHSARDRQENSVAIQQELVQKRASEHGVDIVHEFADRGKSGLTAEGRDGFLCK